ncbi:ScyD/ScyE family protein [Christiangramia sp. SM2212]|uniref:ScyD/ScyE family protein n=1 Tax=Christiangramia sediminicola TaxID=3073267 RepID=A0ABU1EPH8_9FLAO|nr:ScyD/ScyE family protein [Christiangramia sp. SM2212]MDR5590296.1 ScyD/ScyE family protein [Christiangramia sp. SM2212]
MRTKTNSTNHLVSRLLILSFLAVFTAACEKESSEIPLEVADLKGKNAYAVPYEFPGGLVYDISATPDGSIMVGVNEFSGDRSIQLIKNGEITKIIDLNTNTDINGIESLGAGNAFFTTAGVDLAQEGELYRASNGKVRMVADLAKFERDNDPDAFEGPQWKNQQCEEEFTENGQVVFSAGPQNNPYKLTAFDGETVLVADAAGNTVLQATTEGDVDWKAILTPPLNDEGEWMEFFQTTDGDSNITCYVQPVPTSVAIADDGFIYVGELSGATPGVLPVGISRVWKMPTDGINMVCSEVEGSPECNVLISGLTSVIDVVMGPDGLLYIVEFDANSFLSAFVEEIPMGGGTISAYDTEGNFVKTVAENLVYPSAVTFDKKGNLWVLENKLFIGGSSTVSML